jgi:hypothetical protein
MLLGAFQGSISTKTCSERRPRRFLPVQRAVVEAALQAGANPFDPAARKAIAQAVRGEYRKRGCYRLTIKALCRQRLHSPKPLVPLPVRRPRSSKRLLTSISVCLPRSRRSRVMGVVMCCVWVSAIRPHRPIVVRATRPEAAFRSSVLVVGILNEVCVPSSLVPTTSRSLKEAAVFS